MQIHDLAYGGLDTITSQIERYSDPTFSKMALCQKIRGIAGLSNGLKAIELDEVSFLFRTEFPMLFSEVLKYERRIHTISEHLDLYTRERDRLIDSMEPYSYQLIDGAQHVAYANIPDDVSLVIDKKSASLDKSIERLRQELDSSVAAIRHVCESYLIAAKTCFGDEFPDVAILWEAPKELGLKYGENDANP